MSKWKMVKLTDICDFQGGTQPPKDEWIEEEKDGYIRMLQIRDFTQDRNGKIEYVKNNNILKQCTKNDILIARYGASVGKILTGLAGAYNVAIVRTLPDESKILKIFLKNYLMSNSFQNYIKNVGSRAAQAGFNKCDLEKLTISLPPLEEQKRIADILDKASNLIDLRKQQLEKMDLLVRSKFIDMFGDYLVKNINPRTLPEVTKFIDYRGRTPEKSNKGIPLITAKNVKDNAFSVEPQEFIPEENYNEVMNRGIPKINDVLFTTEAPLGNVCRIPDIFGKFCVGQRLITMQPVNGLVTSEFLEYVLLSKEFQDEMWKKSSGSTVKGIRSKELAKLTIPVPPIELQDQFAAFVEQVEKQKEVMQQSLEKMETNYKALMQEFFG